MFILRLNVDFAYNIFEIIRPPVRRVPLYMFTCVHVWSLKAKITSSQSLSQHNYLFFGLKIYLGLPFEVLLHVCVSVTHFGIMRIPIFCLPSFNFLWHFLLMSLAVKRP